MKTCRLVLLIMLVAETGSRIAAEEKSWVGKSVVYTKPYKDIKFGDRVNGEQVWFSFSGRLPLRVREDRKGMLRIHDGQREAWANKADFVLVRDAPAYFHKRVQDNPRDTWALYMRGSGWLEKGEPDKAIQDFNECIRLDPTDSAAFNGRGYAWEAKREYDKAVKDYDEAIRLDPKYVLAFNNRGVFWGAKGEYDKAIKDFDEAIRLDPKDASIFLNRGCAWCAKKEHNKAIKDLDEAIRLDPQYARAFSARGYTWADKKEQDKAIKDFDEAIRLDPKDALAFSSRGNAWRAKKEYAKAIKDYDEVIRLNPKDASAHYNRSVALMITRQKEAAGGFQAVLDLQGWEGDLAPYAVLLGNFAARQATDEAAALRFLKDSTGKLDEAWPYPAVKFLRGEIDEAALLKEATDDDKRTEAHCFLGLDHALKGRKDKTLVHYRWVKEHGNVTFNEYTISLAELERLERLAEESKR